MTNCTNCKQPVAPDDGGAIWYHVESMEMPCEPEGQQSRDRMAEPEPLPLGYGARQYLAPGLKAAWGARLIVTEGGVVDLVGDRQDLAGDYQPLMAWLNGGAIKAAREALRERLIRGEVHTREAAAVIVFEDEQGMVVGNTNGSGGYFYAAAWLFNDAPDGRGDSVIRAEMEQR